MEMKIAIDMNNNSISQRDSTGLPSAPYISEASLAIVSMIKIT